MSSTVQKFGEVVETLYWPNTVVDPALIFQSDDHFGVFHLGSTKGKVVYPTRVLFQLRWLQL